MNPKLPQHTLYKIFCNNINLSFQFISVLIDLSALLRCKYLHHYRIKSKAKLNFLRFHIIIFYCRNYVDTIIFIYNYLYLNKKKLEVFLFIQGFRIYDL